MSGSIADFLGNLMKGGVSKTSHFDVLIPAANPDLGRDMSFRCEAAEIPGRQIATTDNKIYGPVYKTPFQSVYAESSLRFVETANFDIRVFFETWMDTIWDSSTNQMSYPEKWMREIQIIQYDVTPSEAQGSNLKKVLTCKLRDAFPINVNQMPTDWTDDSFHRVMVTFAYRSYKLLHHSKGA